MECFARTFHNDTSFNLCSAATKLASTFDHIFISMTSNDNQHAGIGYQLATSCLGTFLGYVTGVWPLSLSTPRYGIRTRLATEGSPAMRDKISESISINPQGSCSHPARPRIRSLYTNCYRKQQHAVRSVITLRQLSLRNSD